MNASLHEPTDALPWYRQFWPWFIIALPATAVVASFITLWIAIDAAPDRIDGVGTIDVPVEMTADRTELKFDLGPPNPDAPWPASLTVTLVSRADGGKQRLLVRQLDEHYYEGAVSKLLPGAHDVTIVNDESGMRLRGSWAYPAPVWKLRADE